jgi:hypothetical protein
VAPFSSQALPDAKPIFKEDIPEAFARPPSQPRASVVSTVNAIAHTMTPYDHDRRDDIRVLELRELDAHKSSTFTPSGLDRPQSNTILAGGGARDVGAPVVLEPVPPGGRRVSLADGKVIGNHRPYFSIMMILINTGNC